MNDKQNPVLRTAVIGLGRAGWQMHIPQITANAKFNLIAVADPLPERLDEAELKYNTRGYTDCETMFKNESLDLVVIASPTHLHADQAIEAFKNGVDVFTDKPVASSLQETDRMIEAMKLYKRKLMVYMPHRAYAEGVSLKNILDRNLIGKIYMIQRAWSRYRIREDWQAFRKYGGGELKNSGSHFIDQLLYLSGSRFKNIKSYLRKIISAGDAEDFAKILIETENEIILDLTISMAAAYPIPQWQIFGERGSIVYEELSKSWKIKYYLKEEFEGIKAQNSLAAKDRSYCDEQGIPWKEETIPVSDYSPVNYYDKCYEYYCLDKSPFVAIEETRELMSIIETCADTGIGNL